MPGVVSLRYSALLWQYPTSPESLHAWRGLVAVFDFAVVVSDFALISNRFLQVVVTAPGHGCRERGLWREIICDFDLLRFTLQVICTLPRRTTPVGFPSFPVTPEKQNNTKENSTKGKQNKTKRPKLKLRPCRGAQQTASSVSLKSQRFCRYIMEGNF